VANEAKHRTLEFRIEPRGFANDALAKPGTGVTAFNCDPLRRGELSNHKGSHSKVSDNRRNSFHDFNPHRITVSNK